MSGLRNIKVEPEYEQRLHKKIVSLWRHQLWQENQVCRKHKTWLILAVLFRPFGFIALKTYKKLFDISIYRFWAYLMKVITETYLMKVITETYLMKVIPETRRAH